MARMRSTRQSRISCVLYQRIRKFNYVPTPCGMPRALRTRELCRLMGFPEEHIDGYGEPLPEGHSEATAAGFLGDSFQV
eukprot:7908197-Pyramimonas_sp.AAC.1